MTVRDDITRALDQQVNSKRIEEVDDCLTPTEQLLVSQAISAKRQADAFERIAWAVEQLAEAMNVNGEWGVPAALRRIAQGVEK